MRKLLGIVSLLSLALMLGFQNYPYVPPAPVSGGGTPITAVEYLCRDHQGTIAKITCATGSGDTTTKTIPLGTATTAGELIVAITLGVPDGASSGTITDVGGTGGAQTYVTDTNAYTGLQGGHGDYTLRYVCNSEPGVTSVVWTPEASDSAGNSAMIVAHYKGLVASSSCHDVATVWSNTAQATAFTGTSATTTNAMDLLIGPTYLDANVTGCSDKVVTGTSGWTSEAQGDENADGSVAALLDQVVSSTGAYHTNGTATTTGTCIHSGITAFQGTP